MSQTIENRIVEMQFENKQFESGVQESLSTLDKLKKALKFEDASKNLQDFSKGINKNMDFSGLERSVNGLSDKFSASGIAGMEVIRKLTDFALEAGKTIVHALDAPFAQIRQGGWSRAMNIEDAKFQLKGLEVSWDSVKDSINDAVADTAFGLDAAAKACAQLSASGVRAGQDMTSALRGISGVAAMANTEYENISPIFTKIAGQGKAQAREFQQIATYGLNASASIRDFFNDIVTGNEKTETIPEDIKKKIKDLTKGLKVSEQDIRDFAHDSEIDFKTFSYAMDYAFGEHAKAANETFMGSLRNIKAALSKIGAEFATPIIQGSVPVFNQIRVFLNDLRKSMGPVFEIFKNIANIISDKLTKKLEAFSYAFIKLGAVKNIGNAINNVFTSLVKILVVVRDAFQSVFKPTKSFENSIVSISKGIEEFSKKLIISDDALIVLRSILVSVFSVLRDVGNVIKLLLPTVGKVGNIILNIISVIAKLIGYIIQLVSQLDLASIAMFAIQKAGEFFAVAIEKIKLAFTKLRSILTDTNTVTGKFAMKLKDIATFVVAVLAGSIYLAFTKLKEAISYFDTHDPLGSLINGVKDLVAKLKELPVLKDIVSGIEIVFEKTGEVIKKIVDLFKDFINNIKSGMTVLQAFGKTIGTIFEGVIIKISEGINKITSIFSSLKGKEEIEENFEMPVRNAGFAMDGVVGTLEKGKGAIEETTGAFSEAKKSISDFANSIVDFVKGIDTSRVLLFSFSATAVAIGIAFYKLVNSVKDITSKVSKMLSVFTEMHKKKSSFLEAMIGLSLGIGTLAASLWALSKIPVEQLKAATIALGSLLAVIGLFSIIGKQGSTAFAASMISFSAGVALLVGALYALDYVNFDNIWTKVAVLGTIVAGMAGISILLSKFAPSFSKGGLAIVAFSGSIYIMAKALEIISKANLANIKSNYKELSVVILAFGAFAALASNIGITAALGLLSFIAVLKILEHNVGAVESGFEVVKKVFSDVAEALKSTFKYFYESLKKVSEDISKSETLAKTITNGVGAVIGGLIGTIIAIGIAGKGIKKAAVGFTLIIASIAGLMYVTMKIAEMSQNVDSTALNNARGLLESIMGFITILSIVMLAKEWLSIKSKGKKVNEVLKDVRKLLTSLGIMLVALGAFTLLVSAVPSDKFAFVHQLLIETEIMVAGIAILCTAITAFASKAGKSEVGFQTFAGIVVLLGTLIGSIAGLGYMFSQVPWEENKALYISVGIAFGLLTAAIILILHQIANIEKAKPRKSILTFAANITAITLLVSAIAGFSSYMAKNLSGGELVKVAAIALGIIAIIYVISRMVLVVQGETAKFAKGVGTKDRLKAFKSTMLAIVEYAILFGVLAVAFYGLQDVEAGRMVGQALAMVGVLKALTLLSTGLLTFINENKISNSKTQWKTLGQIFSIIAAFAVGFAGLAIAFNYLKEVNAGRMWGQATAITTVLLALTLISVSMLNFVKESKSTSWANIGKVAAIIGGMEVLFLALTGIFAIIDNFSTSGGQLIGKSQTIVLALTELGIIAGILGAIVSNSGNMVVTSLIGQGVLLGMIALFGLLTLVFKAVDNLKGEHLMAKSHTIILVMAELTVLLGILSKFAGSAGQAIGATVALAGMVGLFYLMTKVFEAIDNFSSNGKELIAKSQTIILVMAELIALITAMGALVQYANGLFAVGGVAELALWPMIALFGMLADVFVVIDGLKTEGIMKKSQTIILVMTELIALISAMGGLVYAGGVSLIGGIAELALWPMILLFDLLADVFVKINNLKTEGIMAKSQTIILVMTELIALIALMGGLVYAAGIGLIGGLAELALWPMILLFGLLADVFVKINDIKTEGIMAKSQTMVLVLLELEALIALLGVLAPVALLALAGMPALLGITAAMNLIALALVQLSSIPVDQMKSSIDILVGALWSLMGIGVAGITAGPGLLAVALGIGALGLACGVVSVALMAFSAAVLGVASSITVLTATGPGILSWFTNIAMGVTTLSISVMTAIQGLSTSIVTAVNTLLNGIAEAITNGGTKIYDAAKGIGDKFKEGFDVNLNPFEWGADLIANFVDGIKSGLPSIETSVAGVAKTIWSYLHFSTPEKGACADADTWMKDFSDLLANTFNIDKLLGKIESGVGSIKSFFTDKLGININWDEILNSIGLDGSANDIIAKIKEILQAIGLLKGELSTLTGIQKGLGTNYEYVNNLQNKRRKLTEALTRAEKTSHEQFQKNGQTAEWVTQRTKYLNAEIGKLDDQILEASGLTKGLNEALGEGADAFDEYGDSAGGAGKGVAEAKDEIADFYDMIKSSINLFEEFNKETDLTSDKLLENMRSQISGITEWSGMIAKLSTTAIDQGLLKELADMGPQGYQYTKAFVDMTAEQIAEASHIYQQSMILPQAVTAHVFSSFAYAGQQSAEGFFQGLTRDSVRDQGIAFAKELLVGVEGYLQIQSPSRVMYEDGAYTGIGFANGLGGNAVMSILKGTLNKICRTVVNGLKDGVSHSEMLDIGRNIAQGLADGIAAGESDVKVTVLKMVNAVKSAAKSKKGLDEHSPSRVFQEIGEFVTLGLAKGITEKTSAAVSAIEQTSASVIDQMRETINKANEALIDDVDDPVIKPVLDLSDIESGSRSLNDMLSRNSAFSAGRSFSNLQNGQWASQSALLNATMDNTDVVSAIGLLQQDIVSLKDAMTNIKMVLDTGTMVGAMTPAIDQQMGMRQVYAGRGI